ncbi:hypothetical protein BJX68DRAFT_263371 [Aspergillus pseudodeflectus]|uniref:Arrestin-like N-terminal domain-containing protein n=1 Tax=Aspergillus pseudodeflectus TaxID=176178 RepID=A0ABR4KX30_9EURO
MSTHTQTPRSTRTSPILQITLDNANNTRLGNHPSYKPGDTISGHITLTNARTIPSATITVTLTGRSTTTIAVCSTAGHAESRYESSFDIFDGCVETLVVHSDAPLSVSTGTADEGQGEGGGEANTNTWPFALTVPFSVRDIWGYAQRTVGFYSSPDGSDGPTFIPPGSFGVDKAISYEGGSIRRGRAEVSYAVQTKVEIGHLDAGTNAPATVTHTATAPFRIDNLSLSDPITDFGRKIETAQRGVLSYNLVPGAQKELNLARRARRALMSPRPPGFMVKVSVSLPVFLQVGNANVIPLSVVFEPVSTSVSEVLRDVPQTATITSLSMRLRPRTVLLADKMVVNYQDTKTCTAVGRGISILPFTAILDLRSVRGQDISVQFTPGSTSSSSSSSSAPASEPLDLGALLDFRLREDIHPTFQTYNIARTWDLVWEMDVSIAGQVIKVGSSYEVIVLPRAWDGLGPVRDALVSGAGEVLPEYGRDEELPAYSA